MSEEVSLKCGVVSIVGRANVGKSTLMNRLVDEKIAIVSNVPQTTRTQIRGVFNDDRGQIVFIDTPGLHTAKDNLDRAMHKASLGSLEGIDCLIHLVDSNERTGEEEENLIRHLKNVKVPIIVGLNKIDVSKGKHTQDYIALWEDVTGKPITELEHITLFPLSAMEGTNVSGLIDVIYDKLPISPPFYDRDVVCDMPNKLAVADAIREKLFFVMKDEVPHSIGVVIEEMRPIKGKKILVRAVILVERKTQKEMVIGKQGRILKEVGTKARIDIEHILGQQIFLEIFVKVKKDWRNDISLLCDLGYQFGND